MNNFLSGISITLSAIALALSGWTAYQISLLNNAIASQEENLEQQQQAISQQGNEIAELNQTLEAKTTPPPLESTPVFTSDSNTTSNSTIEPGQFVQKGFDNQIKIELLSVKRIKNSEGDARDVVVVQLRMRRLVSEPDRKTLSLYQAKGRNPETSEVYSTMYRKYSNSTSLRKLPQDSWGDGYFWLQEVPNDVNVIDIVIPDTAIFNKVPISNS